MNIHMVTVGSRGDIDPLIALGIGLAANGHSVTMVANSEGRQRAEKAGLRFADLEFSVAALLSSAQGSAMIESGSSHKSRTILLDAAAVLHPIVGPKLIQSCAGSDVILSTETVHLLSRSIAEKKSIPHIALGFAPYGRTDAYSSFYADTPELRSLPNLQTHEVIERYHHRRLLPAVNTMRIELLGLPALDEDRAYEERENCPAILGYSPSICPPPPDWPAHRTVAGYWMLPGITEVSPELKTFIESGPPPLYVGFGSMRYDPARLAPVLLETAARTGVRMVYATGWAADSSSNRIKWPAGIFVAPEVPHQWLLPKVIGALYHGGAGTTAAAISAGVPSLIAWMIVDQIFWAGRIENLGAGLNLGNFHDLQFTALADAVVRLQSDPAFALNSATLGAKVRSEDGIGRAVAAIEYYVRQLSARGPS